MVLPTCTRHSFALPPTVVQDFLNHCPTLIDEHFGIICLQERNSGFILRMIKVHTILQDGILRDPDRIACTTCASSSVISLRMSCSKWGHQPLLKYINLRNPMILIKPVFKLQLYHPGDQAICKASEIFLASLSWTCLVTGQVSLWLDTVAITTIKYGIKPRGVNTVVCRRSYII